MGCTSPPNSGFSGFTFVDSELIVNQVMGESNCHDSNMVAYR
jgi:hypothetical protein